MAQTASTRRVFLIGFMGAGKTSVGRALAQRLGWSFQDLDDVIESRQGISIAQIFADSGEVEFRRIETAALRGLLQQEPAERDAGTVMALGGGAFAQPENRKALSSAGGAIVLLEAPIEEMRRRCAGEADSRARPLAADPERFAELYRARRSVYELAPLRVLNVNKTVEQAAAEIEDLIAATAGRR
jgi:shikimate kinase